MLHVVGCLPVQEVVVEVDDYIPLRFRCSDVADPVPLYWRTGNFNSQLIEVGLNSLTGAICKVTVTVLGELVVTSSKEEAMSSAKVVPGVPLCEIKDWPSNMSIFKERFRDEVKPFQAFLRNDSVIIAFQQESAPQAICRAGQVDFGIDEDDNLCSITFTGLTGEDMERIMTSLS